VALFGRDRRVGECLLLREERKSGLQGPISVLDPKPDMIHLVMAIDNNLHQDHFILQGRYDLLLAPQWGW
jgi:hypothetical protein